jgi:hypothetical protein
MPDLASFHTGAWITNIIAGIMVVSVAIFTAGFAYILIEALVNTPFNLSLSQGVSNFSFSFFVYGFVSIEAVFAGVVIFFGYSTIRTALRRKILEIEVE